MELVDNIIKKYGSDKVIHFVCGGWITSVFSLFGLWSTIIGVLFTFIISFVKEKYLDDFFDKKDIIAAMVGSGISVLIYVLFVLI